MNTTMGAMKKLLRHQKESPTSLGSGDRIIQKPFQLKKGVQYLYRSPRLQSNATAGVFLCSNCFWGPFLSCVGGLLDECYDRGSKVWLILFVNGRAP